MSDSVTQWTVYPTGSSVHGVHQGRILEWVAMPSCSESSPSRDEPVSPVTSAMQADSLLLSYQGKFRSIYGQHSFQLNRSQIAHHWCKLLSSNFFIMTMRTYGFSSSFFFLYDCYCSYTLLANIQIAKRKRKKSQMCYFH